MAKNRAPYVFSYARYMELENIRRTIGLSARQSGEYDFQRSMFEFHRKLSQVLAPIVSQ